VRVLLDEQLPRQLASHITGHDVRTVQQEGWAGTKNGELIRRAVASGFQAFVTADQNLQFQQNLTSVQLAVVVISAPSNALEDILPCIPALRSVLAEARPGELLRVSAA